MTKKIKLFVGCSLIVAMCVLSSGCSTNNQKDEDLSYDSTKTEWSNEVIADNLIADFDIGDEVITDAYTYSCKRIPVSVQTIKNTFFDDVSATEVETRLYDQDVPELGYIEFLTSEDGLNITSSLYGTDAEASSYNFYTYFLSADSEAWGNNNVPVALGTEEELEYLSKISVEEQIRSGLKQLFSDIEVSSMKFFTLSTDYLTTLQEKDLDALSQEEDTFWYDKAKQYERNWEEDGAYYVFVEMKMDQIAINEELSTFFSNDINLETYSATFIYNKDGCVYVKLPSAWEIENKKNENIISVAQAVEALKTDVTSVILTEENIIDEAQLQYVVLEKPGNAIIEIRPMWIFNSKVLIESEKTEGQSIQEYYEQIYVDAVTGEVLR